MNKQNKEITKQDLPLLVQAKSSDLQQKYLTAYNQAISKGLSSSEAEFSAYNQLRIAEKQLRSVVEKKAKPKVPEHLLAVLQRNNEPEELVKAVEEQSKSKEIISVEFDLQGHLVITFSDFTQIKTKGKGITEYIESYSTVIAGLTNPVEYLEFQTQLPTAPEYVKGRLFYDNTTEALSYYNDAHDVTLNIGQEQVVRVYNNTGTDVLNGQAVYINGANTGFPTIALAQANNEVTATAVIGIATHDIHDHGYGYITTLGIVRGLNTSAYTAGQVLYLSATAPGGITTSAPLQPNYNVVMGYVIISDTTQGSLFVRVDKQDWFPSLELVDNTASRLLPEVPTLFTYGVARYNDGFLFDNGEITFNASGTYTFNISMNAIAGSSNKKIYFYTEENTGSGWVVNTYTGRELELVNAAKTQVVIGASRYFRKGSKIRFYIWADASVSLVSTNLPGTTPGTVVVPAYRATVA
jgi:hypothetical protein